MSGRPVIEVQMTSEEFQGWKNQIRAEALREAAEEIEGMGVEPWDRLTPAIRALQHRAAQLDPGGT